MVVADSSIRACILVWLAGEHPAIACLFYTLVHIGGISVVRRIVAERSEHKQAGRQL